MEKCKLCLKADATQTGSHLISNFIVTSMLGERDNEYGHLISSEGGDYNKNRKADEIKEDYIFCRGCESRLSYLEGYFSKEFTNKFGNNNYLGNFQLNKIDNTSYFTPTKLNHFAFHLLINSIIWRAHLSSKQLFRNFNLPKPSAEDIRLTLDTVLPIYKDFKVKGRISTWLKDLDSVKSLVNYFPYVIFRTNLKDKDKTENYIYFGNFNKHPFHIIINEFIILAFFIGKKINFKKQDFFELNSKYNLNFLLNKDIDELKIGILKYKDWLYIRGILGNLIKEKNIKREIKDICIKYAQRNRIKVTISYMKHCCNYHKKLYIK